MYAQLVYHHLQILKLQNSKIYIISQTDAIKVNDPQSWILCEGYLKREYDMSYIHCKHDIKNYIKVTQILTNNATDESLPVL